MTREIKVYYETWSHEDMDTGETDNRGEAFTLDCEPDVFDQEDGKSAVDLAFAQLQDHGPFEPSSWPGFHAGIWYSDTDGSVNYRTGERTIHSYHPHGFNEAEERQLFDRLTAKG
jgi:hypothetical protein